MEQRISLVTLGVTDLARARSFYEALGWADAQQPDDEVCFFQAGGMVFGLWAALGGHGAPGIELAHNVRSPEEVGAVLAEAERAGATIVRPAARAEWGGTSGAFADPDGYVWEIAHNPGWTLDEDGTVRIPTAGSASGTDSTWRSSRSALAASSIGFAATLRGSARKRSSDLSDSKRSRCTSEFRRASALVDPGVHRARRAREGRCPRMPEVGYAMVRDASTQRIHHRATSMTLIGDASMPQAKGVPYDGSRLNASLDQHE